MRHRITLITLTCLALAGTTMARMDDSTRVELRRHKLSGPRLGMTYVVHGSKFDEALDERDIDNFISQFGWHFEWLVRPVNGGPAFVTELIPFLGGVEYGTVIPSASLVLGIRTPRGWELGMGPSVVFTFEKGEPVNSSLLVAAGKSLDFSGIKIPLNLAVSTNSQGQRVSFVFGYALAGRRRTAG